MEYNSAVRRTSASRKTKSRRRSQSHYAIPLSNTHRIGVRARVPRAATGVRGEISREGHRDSTKPHWCLSAWFDQRGYAWFDQRGGPRALRTPRLAGTRSPGPRGRRRGPTPYGNSALFGPRRSALSTTIATTSRQQWTIGRQGQVPTSRYLPSWAARRPVRRETSNNTTI